MEKAKTPYRSSFLRWSSKNVKKQKKWIFSKHFLTLFVSGRENVHTICFWPKIFLDQNSVNQEKL